MKKIRKMLMILLCLMFFTGCSKTQTEEPELVEPQNASRAYCEVVRKDLYNAESIDAEVVPVTTEVYFERFGGKVGQRNVSVGDQVKKGDELLYLDQESLKEQEENLQKQIFTAQQNNEYDNQIRTLEIETAKAELEILKYQNAKNSAILDQQHQIEVLELQLKQQKETQNFSMQIMQSKLEQVQTTLKEQYLIAPVDGTIVYAKAVNPGDSVTTFETLFVIASDEELRIETDYISKTKFRSADRVEAVIGEETFQVEIVPYETKEYLRLALAGKTVHSFFTVVGNNKHLSEGQYVALTIYTSSRENALTVPVSAMHSDEEGKYVYVRREDGTSERRSVEVGIHSVVDYEILSGLQEGELVYVKE